MFYFWNVRFCFSLVTQTVNVDELDYLAKRLDSFCQGEIEKFQAMASNWGNP